MSINRRDFLKAQGALVIGFSMFGGHSLAAALPAAKGLDKEQLDSWLTIGNDGKVTCYSGKVDLGTGTRTALAQMVAEELDVAFDQVEMVMGDTATTPDQWLTGANLTIAMGGVELRKAAASARNALAVRGAQKLGVALENIVTQDGKVMVKGDTAKMVAYADLLGEGFKLKVDPKVVTKDPSLFTIVGRSVPRVDIPAKVTGEFSYVHDVRLPGMLHARVIRPEAFGARIEAVDEHLAKQINGFVRVVRKDNFLAVVASNEWAAIKAARALQVTWSAGTGLPDSSQLMAEWRKGIPGKSEVSQRVGDVVQAIKSSSKQIKASYDFAIQTHASIGPSCAVAEYQDGQLTLWSASQATHSMQAEVAAVTGVAKENIRLLYVDGSGCYGRNGHEDATADAALIAVLIGKPVRVQWMREDETARAPKSPPTVIDLEASIDDQGNVVSWESDFYIGLNHIVPFKNLDFPLLSGTDIGLKRPGNFIGFVWMNATQPYAFPNTLVKTHHINDIPFRSSHLRSPGRVENNFANESFADELAALTKTDAAEFRLRHLKDPRAIAVIKAAMQRANWQSRPGPNADTSDGKISKGRGIAYVRYNDKITYVAAVAEVEVNRETGDIKVTRICIGHDCGQMINPNGVANQVEGGVIQTVSRVLMEEVKYDRVKVTSVDWASYPIIRFPDVPRVEVDLIDHPKEAPWGCGEPAVVPIPAAIGNAVFDAIGVRLRSVPFTPEKVRIAMAEAK